MNTLIAEKVGMTTIFAEDGTPRGVTALKVTPSVVVQIKTQDAEGYDAVQIGFGKNNRLNKPAKGHRKQLGDFAVLREVRCSGEDEYELGQKFTSDIFEIGEKVDVVGINKGKGFAGVVKRYNFHRGPMSHGSDHHRRVGSIGACATPGRVLKGKKMPGRMGNKRVTVQGLEVAGIDQKRELLYIRGGIPGAPGNIVVISKSVKSKSAN